jgi:hypothetical protein
MPFNKMGWKLPLTGRITTTRRMSLLCKSLIISSVIVVLLVDLVWGSIRSGLDEGDDFDNFNSNSGINSFLGAFPPSGESSFNSDSGANSGGGGSPRSSSSSSSNSYGGEGGHRHRHHHGNALQTAPVGG